MDSFTQMTLGAAVGEAVLGKKAGNRAMLWGAIAGTIPDLDVLSNYVADDLTALAFHRGFTHSILFAILAPFLYAWLVDRFYKSGLYQQKLYKSTMTGIWLLVYVFLCYSFHNILSSTGETLGFVYFRNCTIIGIIFAALLGWGFFRSKPLQEKISRKEWAWLFFWATITHPLLDSCTSYGTQLFQPFWDYRVALNNVSVVDPIYTVPFLICLIIAGFLTRTGKYRRIFNYLGIGLSCAYLLFTFYNKYRVNQVFEASLASKNIDYQRYMTAPSIFNNILWQGVAEGDTAYYHGLYSFLDEKQEVLQFTTIPKNHHLIAGYQDERAIKVLKWFSNNYYNIIVRKDGRLQLNDIRFGSTNDSFDSENDYVFRFILEEKDGELVADQTREGSAPSGRGFSEFFKRVAGIDKDGNLKSE